MLETSEEAYDLRRDSLVIALISFAVIVFEIGITRLLSVVLWYHFAFLAISLAMLALGAPGVWFSQRKPRPGLLRGCMLGGSLTIPLSISGSPRSENGHPSSPPPLRRGASRSSPATSGWASRP